MNQLETLKLFAQGKEKWNAWANDVLAKRRELEVAGKWEIVKNDLDEWSARNEETRAWFDAARAQFSSDLDKHTFEHPVDFYGWVFPSACFVWATFEEDADFRGAIFSDHAEFKWATFRGDALFNGATFKGDAEFRGAMFAGNTKFEDATFLGEAHFNVANFKQERSHDDMFEAHGWRFSFDRATFLRDADFSASEFSHDAGFGRTTFLRAALFAGARFRRKALFSSTKFDGYTSFADAEFLGAVRFNAAEGKAAFTLERAQFRQVPDFIQANFVQAPRLDNVIVTSALTRLGARYLWPVRFFLGLIRRLFGADENVPARYRALKRLAIQGYDQEREQDFFAGEIRSARFATDWPLPVKFWRANSWSGFYRFWFGLLYQLFSGFGSSVARPTIAWLTILVIFTAVYLGANPEMEKARGARSPEGVISVAAGSLGATLEAILASRKIPCFAGDEQTKGLGEAIASRTDAVSEAFRLSVANAFVFGDLAGHDVRRTYGCLYGLESAEAPVVPGISSDAARIQKFLSAILIFLFGLALRNMLRLK